jgi:hypothetical protein
MVGELDCKRSIKGLTARAYIAIARVPSEELDLSTAWNNTTNRRLVCIMQDFNKRWTDDTDVMKCCLSVYRVESIGSINQ